MARVLDLLLGPHRFETESPWGVFTGICAIFGTVILSLVLMVVVGAALSFALPDDAMTCLAGGMTSLAPGCSRWLLGMVGGSSLVFIVAFYALAHARKGGSPENVLLLRRSGLTWWQYILVTAAMIGVVIASLNAISLATGADEADFEVGIEYMKDLVSGSGWLNWLLIISVVVILGPITEEIVFRGFLFTTLIKTPIGFVGSAIITSALWSVLHYQYNWQVLVALFVFGVALSFIVWRTGSLWPGIVAHAANNLASALILLMR